MKTPTIIAIVVLAASTASAQSNASTTTSTQTNASLKHVRRVRIPTYLAESMTRQTVLPRDIGISGDVVLELLVGKDGKVLKVRGVSGDSGLMDAAKPAMAKWVFSPYFLNGEPVQFLAKLTLQFDGNNGSAKLKLEDDPLTTHAAPK